MNGHMAYSEIMKIVFSQWNLYNEYLVTTKQKINQSKSSYATLRVFMKGYNVTHLQLSNNVYCKHGYVDGM